MLVEKSFYEEFEIDLTGTCNLNCPLCTRNYLHADHTTYKKIRSLDEITSQLDEFTGLKKAFIAGQVSEPTLYPDLLGFMSYLKSRDISIKLFTNGNTRDSNFWKELSLILGEKDEVHFTLCGSTQELHSKYRVGSDLNQLLENASYFRSSKKNDFCQYIRFTYNSDDESNVKKIYFSNHYSVDSEGDRLFNEKKKPELKDVRPLDNREQLIRYVLRKPEKVEVRCRSLQNKKMYITQSGKVNPCYMINEYNDDFVFNYDYSSILDWKYSSCYVCDQRVQTRIKSLNLDFIC